MTKHQVCVNNIDEETKKLITERKYTSGVAKPEYDFWVEREATDYATGDAVDVNDLFTEHNSELNYLNCMLSHGAGLHDRDVMAIRQLLWKIKKSP